MENKVIIVLPDVVAKQAFLKLEGSENSVLIDGDKAENFFRDQLTPGEINENCDCYQILSNSIDEVCGDGEKDKEIAQKIKEIFKQKYECSLSTALNSAFKEAYKDSGKDNEEILKMAAKSWANYATETNIIVLQAELENPKNKGKKIILVPPPKIAANEKCVKKIQGQLEGNSVEFVKCFGPTSYESFKLAAMESNAFTNHFTKMKNVLLENYANDEEKKQEIEANYTILIGGYPQNKTNKARIKAKQNMFKLLEENGEAKEEFKNYLANELKGRQDGISNVANNLNIEREIKIPDSKTDHSILFSFSKYIVENIPCLTHKKRAIKQEEIVYKVFKTKIETLDREMEYKIFKTKIEAVDREMDDKWFSLPLPQQIENNRNI